MLPVIQILALLPVFATRDLLTAVKASVSKNTVYRVSVSGCQKNQRIRMRMRYAMNTLFFFVWNNFLFIRNQIIQNFIENVCKCVN